MFGPKPKNFKIGKNFNETAECIMEHLPRVAEIESYDLTIQTYFPYPGLDANESKTNYLIGLAHFIGQDFTFDGRVTIRFRITNSTDRFYFNSKNNNISKRCIHDENGQKLNIKNFSIDPTTTCGFVQLDEPFVVGNVYSLRINYTGVIQNEGNPGLFRNKYKTESGETRYKYLN